MTRAGVRLLGLAALLWCGAATAEVPPAELSREVSGRVVHLSRRDAQRQEDGSGTGFVISGDGRCVTNFHVIDGADEVVAVFPDEHEVKVTGVWAFDKEIDLAVLQLDHHGAGPLQLSAEPAREGEEIFVVGSPRGLSNSISTGIVSAVRAKGLEAAGHREGPKSWGLQITAATSPGSSGSPILRADGQVVGVVVGHVEGLEGMNFGIPVDMLRTLLAGAPAQIRPLEAATGVRSVRTNLLISAAVFGGVALVWWLVSRRHRQRSRRGLQQIL